ncbi:uncharacterized protein CCR75_008791 [Bremia lactucae]|uniref:Uncharacterized protein n=1 Tax=Bremia lactucae TaxID=4779 RepID=A0A976II83_BRELC|nr:hypothetical protein CCR75_008791 [Bremia lactucae]
MPLTAASARVNSAWASDELNYLVDAWEEVVDDPKDRLLLSTGERATLHARFCVISGSNKRSLSSVTRQHHRLCTSYRLIVATNKKSLKRGTPGWYELSAAEQHELRRVHSKKEKGVTIVSQELFRRLDRICRGGGKNRKGKDFRKKASSKRSPPRQKKTIEPEEETDSVETVKVAWTAEDWALFVGAWQDAVDEFIDYGNEPDEKVKLPNWLIRQKFVALGGPEDTTVGSITAKKRCIIHSYNFICQCVTALEALDGSDWFDYTTGERFRLQRKLVSPKSSQRVGCEIDRETFHKISSILEKEEILGTVTATGRKRKRGHRILRKSSVSSESSSDESVARSPSPSPSNDDDESEVEEDHSKNSSFAVDDVEESHIDEQVVEVLLEAQNARFEQLMHELREERMAERKQNQAMLLAILHQRNPQEISNQNLNYMETLVEKQQEQLLNVFTQMHKERQQEREDFHALLRQLCTRP